MSDPLVPDARLDLSAAAGLATALRERTEPEVIVDLSEVRHLGALCLQILIAAATAARKDGRSLSLINASDRVIDQLRVMGMTPETIAGGRI
ncbi:STAS domain-containing protein [Roseobacter ponti]|uniref:STAS domain-containing protein n=1 Tax=Roseobacter ponti TaxID=1891787 RepID=A0A858SUJ0_9RHOB|nr:STAS domain-containing protein [Roseobacter ponti]QJF51181.1 STAS domain-containing protein [Roseobacter ponti]